MRDLDVPETLPPRLVPALIFFLKRHLGGMVLLFVLPMTSAAISASYGNATRRITDAVLEADKQGGDLKRAAMGPLLHFIALVSSMLLVRVATWTTSYNNKMPYMADIRRTVFAYVQRHDTAYFEVNLSGKVAHKAATLPDQLRSITERCCFDIFPGAAFFVVSMIFFATARPVFALLIAGWLLVYFGAVAVLGRGAARASSRHNEAKTQLTGRVVDMITNIRNVIANAAHAEEDRVLQAAIDETRRRHSRSYLATVRIRFGQQLLNIFMWILLYSVAIYHWVHHQITAGDFAMIAQLGGQLINRAQDVGEMLPDFIDDIGAASESIQTLVVPRKLLDAPGAKPLEVKRGEILFDRIAFAYPNGPEIFHGFSLRIRPGEKVGLVGASGAGKSTLTTLLLRLHDVQSGGISIDGQDLREVTQASLRGQIALIPQDTVLFYRTLKENIGYGRPGASDAEIVEAARRAHADEFIETLPDRYETLVGERGVKLSGGQRQRVAIARALLKRAPILILDEATSALDSESEALIQRAMREAMAGRTVIAIAHRLSTIAHLDRLIVLEGGEVIEDGSHAELLQRRGLYARLWERQSKGFLTDEDDGVFTERAATVDP